MRVGYLLFWAFTAAIVGGFLLFWLTQDADAHDYKDPKLDAWVGGLMRPHTQGPYGGGSSCCSLDDCHKTEAEYRKDGDWWARIGSPIQNKDGTKDWVLADWVKVPKETIVTGPNGNPVPNMAGEAMICHPLIWKSKGVLDPEHTQVYCFVPPFETRLRRFHVVSSQRRGPAWAPASFAAQQ